MSVETLFAIWSAALGAIFGSFANVCIHRLPRGESVVRPRSRCPHCGAAIAFYDNVPVLSWILLAGRCRACRAPIAIRYPVVEAVTAALFLGIAVQWGPSGRTAAGFLLATSCVVLIATDLEHRILPDEVTLGGAALLGLLAAARDVAAAARGEGFALATSALADALAGAAIGAGLLLLVRQVYFWVRRIEGMGLGDVKMMLLVGAAVGLRGVLPALFLAALSGALFGLSLAALRAARFSLAAGRARRGRADGTRGLLVDSAGIVAEAGETYRAIPGAPGPGSGLLHGRGAVRPLAAFVRLARRRAGRGLSTATDRLFLEEGEFFRVLAVRAQPLGDGQLLVLLGRADVPFGVFLAAGALAGFALGPSALTLLLSIAAGISR